MPVVDRAALELLATDLPRVWEAPSSEMRVKQRIARVLIHEIIANTDDWGYSSDRTIPLVAPFSIAELATIADGPSAGVPAPRADEARGPPQPVQVVQAVSVGAEP